MHRYLLNRGKLKLTVRPYTGGRHETAQGRAVAGQVHERTDYRRRLRRPAAAEDEVCRLVKRANNEGWNWEDCGYRTGQTGLTQRQLWALVKLARSQDRQTIPLKDGGGKPFSYRLTPSAQRILHLIDRNLGGAVRSSFPQIDSDRPTALLDYLAPGGGDRFQSLKAPP